MKISVICYTYNHRNFIRKAMDGFLMQETGYPYEIIVHDDASTDGTQDILQEYQAKYPNRIKLVLQEENLYSQNSDCKEIDRQVFRIAQGEYIAICEGDDYWTDPAKLEKQVSYMESHPECKLCAHEAIIVDVEGKKIADSFLSIAGQWRTQYFRGYGRYDTKDYLLFDAIPTASWVFRKSDFQDCGDVLYGENVYTDMMLRQLLTAKGYMYYMPDAMAVYRYNNPDSLIGKTIATKEGEIKSIEMTINTYRILNKLTDGKYNREIQRVINHSDNYRCAIDGKPILFEGRNYWINADRVLEFCLGEADIYIYGAGLYGRFANHVLHENGIEIKAFVVSDNQNAVNMCDQKPVLHFSGCMEKLKASKVIICSKWHEREISDHLHEYGIKEQFAFHIGRCEWTVTDECKGVYHDFS